MPGTDDLDTRLRAADTRWVTARGVIRHRRRHDLVTVGFERHFAALASSDTGWRVGDAPADVVAAATADPTVVEAVLAVAADQHGRRRVEALSRNGDEWLPDLVVVDGDTWWARTSDGVLTNGGDPRHQHGGAEELVLLSPSRVPDGYDLTATPDHEVVAGRRCQVAVATPRPPRAGPRRPGSEVFAMITGGGRFRLSVDADTGVLLRVVKQVDGEDAETVEFLDLVVDAPLPDDLFAALS
ncbi:hypothetical protein ACXR2U_18580 [Jatrophihabitans sp. YIM 134969]